MILLEVLAILSLFLPSEAGKPPISNDGLHLHHNTREVMEFLKSDPDLSRFVQCLESCQVDLDTLVGDLTIFAPHNDCHNWETMAEEYKFTDPDLTFCEAVVRHSVVKGSALHTSEMKNEMLVKTLLKDVNLRINIYGDEAYGKTMTANGAVIVTSNVACTTCRSRTCLVHKISKIPRPAHYDIRQWVSKYSVNASYAGECITKSNAWDLIFGNTHFTAFGTSNNRIPHLPAGANWGEAINLQFNHGITTGTLYLAGIRDGLLKDETGKMFKSERDSEKKVIRLYFPYHQPAHAQEYDFIDMDYPFQNGVLHIVSDHYVLDPFSMRISDYGKLEGKFTIKCN
jgi:hypothetical protein